MERCAGGAWDHVRSSVLYAICERVLRQAMFELPGRTDVERVVVHEPCVTKGEPLEYVLREVSE